MTQELMAVALAALIAASCPSVQAACDPFAPFALPYRVSYGSTPLGTGSLSVFAEDNADCHVFRLTARPYAALRWMIGDLEEESRFCLHKGRIEGRRFHHLQSDDEKHSYSLHFDWATHTVTGGRFASAAIRGEMLDPLSVQLHVRNWVCQTVSASGALPREPLAIEIVDQKGVQSYQLQVAGTETVEVPAGRFETVRVERVDPGRSDTRFWLAREHDFLIVRAQQRRDDHPAVRIELQELARFN